MPARRDIKVDCVPAASAWAASDLIMVFFGHHGMLGIISSLALGVGVNPHEA